MTQTKAWRLVAWSGSIALLALACTSDDGDPAVEDGAVDASASEGDGGGDARAPVDLDGGRPDGMVDASQPRIDARTDTGTDGGADADIDPRDSVCRQEEAELTSFVRANRQCTIDSDCAIIGSCSGTLGFYAVRADARDAGQPLTESSTCGTSDGPTYEAVCENQQCVKRYDGNACGSISSACQSSHALYEFSCPARGLQEATCHQRCSGASDTRCAPDFSCQQREVVAAVGGCEVPRVQTWLCAPKPSCEVVLALESMGKRSRSLLPGSPTPVPLELWATNPTAEPKTFTYQPRCGGELLSGLGSYDAWGACLAGQCDPNPAPKQVTIPAGQRVLLGTANVQATPSTCNAVGLAPGEYEVGFSLSQVQGATVCAPELFELRAR